MRKIISIIFTLMSCFLFATPQIPDVLKYNGREIELFYFSPAHKYFHDKGLKAPKEAVGDSANRDCFTFVYEIFDEKIYLTEVLIDVQKNESNDGLDSFFEKNVFKDYFPNEDKILMDVTSVTVIPYGKMIFTEKYGWSDVHYENYLVFEFINGQVKKSFDFDYNDFKRESKNQFRKLKRTEEYEKLLKSEMIYKKVELYNENRPKKLQLNIYEYIKRNIFFEIEFIQ
jgi:hypothetical protein